MDFLKTLLAYMATTLVVAVESTSTPSVTPVPTPSPTPAPAETAAVETVTVIPALAETDTPIPTVSVTPVPVPTITPNTRGYRNLSQGDKGEEVKRLQQKLIEMGYLPEGSADGVYGGRTRNAVRMFQYYNGLTMDGIAGRATQTNLFENPDAARCPEPETPSPEPEAASSPERTAGPSVTPPVTAPPATAAPATAAPATAAPATAVPTTAAPLTAPPATAAPTTASPVTALPATAAPTTAGPATALPATAAPTAAASAANTPEKAHNEDHQEGNRPEQQELVEDVDLDELEAPEVPVQARDTEQLVYEDLAGWIVLNDSGENMQMQELEDGVPVTRSPRLQKKDDDIRVSLDDLCRSVEGWDLTDEGNSLVLEAQGFTLALLNEDAGFAATVDGREMSVENGDFEFGEGHFIRVDFLTQAMDGSWEWDDEEETLMLRIPLKNSQLYSD